ncbi:APH(3') family aminoglycoside O-phosphotransferase [Paenibacillus aceris]|uniref:Kanamycin kinase/aminoglycoside 3'-phosphotransferase-2 n=1 Tax=Paenibacillus aceris TaxID=869555 RepID=A0ABS4I7A2_9BACL|nr:APH(3') family aminoglycoside O-phosphotransferase [Paenibacillus aceris]MBP1966805.1 kanamycin kinase/aminoglycoside 3'-phosphotransferase-2 [Paenibacillus aceris]NHW39432.1 aminoglycoside 3'-phosphotransferase [Paenibacillus aceris]
MQDMTLPADLSQWIDGYTWHRITLGLSQSQTYLLTGASSNLYIKIQSLTAVESLLSEKERLVWLQGKLPVPEVFYYGQDEANEYLLMTEIEGVNASDKSYSMMLPQLMQQLAYGLRAVHEIPVEGCPFDHRLDTKLEEAQRRIACGFVDEDDFDQQRHGLKAEDLAHDLLHKKPQTEDLVFTHGDYCLPNIILKDGKVHGFIDWGRAGVADRYQDLALAIRSIGYNFGSEHVQTFLNAYGLKELDETKVQYYQLMDEFF